jgi:hypothetical protein
MVTISAVRLPPYNRGGLLARSRPASRRRRPAGRRRRKHPPARSYGGRRRRCAAAGKQAKAMPRPATVRNDCRVNERFYATGLEVFNRGFREKRSATVVSVGSHARTVGSWYRALLLLPRKMTDTTRTGQDNKNGPLDAYRPASNLFFSPMPIDRHRAPLLTPASTAEIEDSGRRELASSRR